MLKLRILTACIAVPLVWLAIFELPGFTFSIIAMLFMLFAAYEWSVLVGDITWRFRILFSLAIVITIIASAYSMWVACVLLSLAVGRGDCFSEEIFSFWFRKLCLKSYDGLGGAQCRVAIADSNASTSGCWSKVVAICLYVGLGG